MPTYIIEKSVLTKRLTTQKKVYENMRSALVLLESELPQNGKRFAGQFIDNFNTKLKPYDLVLRRKNSQSDNGIALYYIGYDFVDERSLEMTTNFGFDNIILFDNGIMKNHTAFLAMIDYYKERLDKYITSYSSALDNIPLFIQKWNTLRKDFMDLHNMRFPIIDIPYVGECPIV